MPEVTSTGGDASGGAQSLLSRLGEFFHIFDLSFLVSGATSLSALLFLFYRLGLSAWFSFSGWVEGLFVVVACYVCGLMSFSIGRAMNTKLFRRSILADYLDSAVRNQGLSGRFISFFEQAEGDLKVWLRWRLYIRLWQQIAAKCPHSVAFHHLSRYWAMAATFDGLAVSFLTWGVVLVPSTTLGSSALPQWLAIAAIPILLGASVFCLWQGAKYYEFQIEDLVAALAVLRTDVE